MFDTINFKLSKYDAGGVNLLDTIPRYLEGVAYHSYSDGDVITGKLGNLSVSLNEYVIKVGDGSLCKWHLGDNYKAMTRGDVKHAIEHLSDTLHLPMSQADIKRLDVGCNIITRHPVAVYLDHLGDMGRAERLRQPDSLYYQSTGQRLCLYDKNKEQREAHNPIPELYTGRNVLRIEQRYTRRIAKQIRVSEAKAGLLYEENHYTAIIRRWVDSYKAIRKINDVRLNLRAMTGKKQLHRMGLLALISLGGGEANIMAQIKEAQRLGELTKKQAFDLRQAVREAMQTDDSLTIQSEAISELDKKVMEAVRFYR